MDIQRAVSEFVSKGKDLFHLLRSKGEALSDVDLMTLREQLHILDTEADHLQNLKQFRLKDLTPSSTKARLPPSPMSRSQHRAA
jgi:hypothetical protein